MLSTNILVHEGGGRGGLSLSYTPLPVMITASILVHLLLFLPPSLHTRLPIAARDVLGCLPHVMNIPTLVECILPPHLHVCPDVTGRRGDINRPQA